MTELAPNVHIEVHDIPASLYGPVADWATDFDHADPEYNANAHEIWADLRDTCPVAHTDRYHGAWLPITTPVACCYPRSPRSRSSRGKPVCANCATN